MNSFESQARFLITEAEKKLSPKSFFETLFGFGKKNRTDDAIECYQKAGSYFKVAKNWIEASDSFNHAADLNVQAGNRYEASNDFVQSARCLEKVDFSKAVKEYLRAIDILIDLGRFVMAAKLHNIIGDIYEQNLEIAEATQHYEQAADYYKAEENYISAKKCLLKVAEYSSSEFQDYKKAIGIFEDIASYDMKTTILQYSVKESLFKATLCHMCVDTLDARKVFEAYLKAYPIFENTIHSHLLKNLFDAVDEGDDEDFIKAVAEYNAMSRLETWHAKLLLRIKRQIKEPSLL